MPRKFMIALLLIATVVLAFAHQVIFFSHISTMTIEKNDAARECSTGGRRLIGLLSPRSRSEMPEFGFLGFCGAIMTDRGYYNYPIRST